MSFRSIPQRIAATVAAATILFSVTSGGVAFADDAPDEAVAPAAAVANEPADAAEPALDAPVTSDAPTTDALPPAEAPAPADVPAPGGAAGASVGAQTTEGALDATSSGDPAAGPAADTIPPTVTIDQPAPPASGWYTATVVIDLTGADVGGSLGSVSYQFDDGIVRTSAGPLVRIGVNIDGRHTIRAWATDTAGNVSTPVTTQVNVDTTGPTVDSYSSPQDRIIRQGARILFTFGCTDDLSGLQSCTTDGRLPDHTLDTSTVGAHSFDIVAVDKAGNRSTTEYRYRVTDDSTPPSVTATVEGRVINGSGWRVDAATAIRLRLDDDTPEQTLIEYWVGRDFGLAAGPETSVPVTTDGVFEIRYSGRDAADNTSTPETLTVRRDTVAPSVVFAASDEAGDPVANGAVVTPGALLRVSYSCDDATSGIARCAGDIISGGLVDTDTVGDHSVLTSATDVAGHETKVLFEYTVAAPQEPTDPGTDPGPVTDPGTGSDGSVGGVLSPPTAPDRPVAAPGRTPTGSLAATGDDRPLPLPLTVTSVALLGVGAVLVATSVRRRRAA
jgi:hypothetical protein